MIFYEPYIRETLKAEIKNVNKIFSIVDHFRILCTKQVVHTPFLNSEEISVT